VRFAAFIVNALMKHRNAPYLGDALDAGDQLAELLSPQSLVFLEAAAAYARKKHRIAAAVDAVAAPRAS
jgi:hypothetical protein